MVTLYCEETPELKLGPGTTSSWPGQPGHIDARGGWIEGTPQREAGDVIVFGRGFAEFNEKDFPEWRAWVAAAGTPHIRVVDESTGEGLASEPHVCPIDGRPFKSEFALNGHMRTHAKETAR
jgi:hypothetical protein